MSVIRKVFLGVCGAALFAAFGYQSIQLVVSFANEATVTEIYNEEVSDGYFDELTMCWDVRNFIEENRIENHTEKRRFVYAKGYWMYSSAWKVPKRIRPNAVIPKDLTKLSHVNSYLAGIFNIKYSIKATVDGAASRRFPVRFVTGLLQEQGQGIIVCFKAKPSKHRYMEKVHYNYLSRVVVKNDGGKHGITKGRMHRTYSILTPKYHNRNPPTSIVYLHLYKGPLWPAIPRQRMLQHEINNADVKTPPLQLAAKMTKFIYVSTRHSPCHAEPAGAIYPRDFAKFKCEVECDDIVSKKLFNCTWFAVITGVEGSIQPCNRWDLLQRYGNNYKTDFDYGTHWLQCARNRNCRRKRFCTEWNIDLTPRQANGLYREYKVKIEYASSQVSVYQEREAMTTEQLAGNIGGLLGMYLGLSLFAIAQLLWTAMIKLKKARSSGDVQKHADA